MQQIKPHLVIAQGVQSLHGERSLAMPIQSFNPQVQINRLSRNLHKIDFLGFSLPRIHFYIRPQPLCRTLRLGVQQVFLLQPGMLVLIQVGTLSIQFGLQQRVVLPQQDIPSRLITTHQTEPRYLRMGLLLAMLVPMRRPLLQIPFLVLLRLRRLRRFTQTVQQIPMRVLPYPMQQVHLHLCLMTLAIMQLQQTL